MLGFQFHELRPDRDQKSPFERLLDIFMEVITHTSGDVDEAMDWMRALDDQYLSLIHISEPTRPY